MYEDFKNVSVLKESYNLSLTFLFVLICYLVIKNLGIPKSYSHNQFRLSFKLYVKQYVPVLGNSFNKFNFFFMRKFVIGSSALITSITLLWNS